MLCALCSVLGAKPPPFSQADATKDTRPGQRGRLELPALPAGPNPLLASGKGAASPHMLLESGRPRLAPPQCRAGPQVLAAGGILPGKDCASGDLKASIQARVKMAGQLAHWKTGFFSVVTSQSWICSL